ncbi:unnamed protein product, partial [Brachionus calyciflorus]
FHLSLNIGFTVPTPPRKWEKYTVEKKIVGKISVGKMLNGENVQSSI